MTRRTFRHEPEAVRRRDLIAATLEAVAELGLAGATVREVAARASVTPGLIRRYFQSKDRLIEAAYAAFVQDMTASVQEQVGEGPPRERLARLAEACCRPPVASPHRIAIWASFISAAHADPAMARVHREGYRAFRELLEAILRDFWQERDAAPDPRGLGRQAIAVNAMIDGIWLEVSLDRSAFDGLDIETLLLDGIIAMLDPQPERKGAA